MRAILHVDMDAFFASVEQLDDPALRGRPVLVGGAARRGVVCAASYEARPFGARSAMPMAQAMRLCPQAVVVPPRPSRYAELSARVFDVFRRYTPLVEGLSLDEAFLDVTASRSLFGDGETIARAIKRDIREQIGLTASAGVAPVKFVAKVASDLRKPDGLVVVAEEQVREFLAPLPIERMWGVGPKTAPHLRRLGIATLGELAGADDAALERCLGSWGKHVQELAQGIDPRGVDPEREAKSVGAEQTYEHDLTSVDAIARSLLAHAQRVAQRLHKGGLAGRIVVVKLKYADFTLRTRRISLPAPVSDTTSIHRAARDLLADFEPGPVRLTGVAVSGLAPVVDIDVQPTLFEDHDGARRARLRRLEDVTAAIADRFGDGLTRAALITPGSAHPGEPLPAPPSPSRRLR